MEQSPAKPDTTRRMYSQRTDTVRENRGRGRPDDFVVALCLADLREEGLEELVLVGLRRPHRGGGGKKPRRGGDDAVGVGPAWLWVGEEDDGEATTERRTERDDGWEGGGTDGSDFLCSEGTRERLCVGGLARSDASRYELIVCGPVLSSLAIA
jgi:hypothetical protein